MDVLQKMGESLGDGVKTGEFAMNDARAAPGIIFRYGWSERINTFLPLIWVLVLFCAFKF